MINIWPHKLYKFFYSEMTDEISKIFVEVRKYCLFSEKRKPESSDDHLLELLGGRLEHSETPFQGLMRELQEEDLSEILANKVKPLDLQPKEILVNHEKHSIYKVNITQDEYNNLRHNPNESYGFQLIEKSVVDDKKTLGNSIHKFTNKTGKIFIQLNMLY
ncbi:MAG: hypothetical protein HOI47_09600 [Candidatus Scalindua sp.]|jgi:hypothetical protein|nr:hypothetical protein [Candidatus Scalindua sp.]MBT6046246.1 hypothetical protein [Candidatus Scalindua sp.]MBT6226897.1 hypothetical protein [Candidatus Scalindua sp.]MBT7212131.1 hypothetical protein [Candidatus Scalindua sp.]MBT7589507.1 hypothetical protein [Candidatus Scalindua sp.]